MGVPDTVAAALQVGYLHLTDTPRLLDVLRIMLP